MYREKLLCKGVSNEQIVAIKFEDLANKKLRDGAELHKFVEARAAKNKKINYVFLDEIQLVSDFAEVINSLRLRGNIDLYATCSNSSLLPHNLPKILGGRYVQVHMFPLSFKEYANTVAEKESDLSRDKMFQSYLEYSSFPEALSYSDLRGA
jgi:predicted AAA+ superfamily ATPase